MTALFLSMALLAQQADTLNTGELNLGLHFYSTASADLKMGFRSLSADTLLVFPQVHYRKEWIQLSAEFVVNYSKDSTSADIEPVSAGAFFKWPGAPWMGTGVSVGIIDPFLPGIDVPVREWQSYDVMDSTAVTVKAGGLLGFQGFWNQYGDSLFWYGVKAPWLGFGTVSWDFIGENSSEIETVSGFMKLKKLQPWFVFLKENRKWTYLAELRGWLPVRSHYYSLEIVPGFSFKEDSNTVGLTAFYRSKNRAIGGSMKAVVDVADAGKPSLAAGLDVLSEAGIAWTLAAEIDRLEAFHGVISGFYRASPAGCGGALDVFDDSLRITATALYSPIPGVSTEFSVMSDLDTDSPEPECLLRVFGASGDFTGGISVEWNDGSTTLGMEVSAWID